MKNRHRIARSARRAFSLVELIVAVTIMAILAALVVPRVTQWIGFTKAKTALDPSEWLIASVPGGERPQVEFRLVGHGIDSTVTLPGGSPAVVRVDADRPAPIARFPIDLNRQGRSDEPW